MDFTVSFRGGAQVARNFTTQYDAMWNRAGDALYLEASRVLREARRLVPVDTGYLWESGYMAVRSTARLHYVVIGFSAPYAIYVHENLQIYHANGQAKYLSQALQESSHDWASRMAENIRRQSATEMAARAA